MLEGWFDGFGLMIVGRVVGKIDGIKLGFMLGIKVGAIGDWVTINGVAVGLKETGIFEGF